MDWRSIRRVDIALAVLAAVVQIGVTARLARHHEHVRALDVYGYLLLAAGPAALLVRRRQPVPVLMLAFATTLGYVLLGYPGGPVWVGLIVAFGTALMTARPAKMELDTHGAHAFLREGAPMLHAAGFGV